MIDIHCHILPYADDGASDMDDALEMARMAADSGVTAIVATPHCNLPGASRENYAHPQLLQQFLQLQQTIHQERIPVRILPGAEVLCTPEVPALLRKGHLLTLAASDYLLVEFFFDEDLDFMDDMLHAIAAEGTIPVIAHPERYQAIQHTPYIIERWFRSGYIIQLNKGSILGRLGRRAEQTADWILARGLAHVVASDGHSPLVRTPALSHLSQHLSDFCAPDYVRLLLEDNPLRIIRNQPVFRTD